jgi:hypothetical protein
MSSGVGGIINGEIEGDVLLYFMDFIFRIYYYTSYFILPYHHTGIPILCYFRYHCLSE